MLQRNRRIQELHRQVRREQLNNRFQNSRQRRIVVQQQEEHQRQTGAFGLQLLQDLAEINDREIIKEKMEQYPLEKFYRFLSSNHDDSRQQLAAIKIIEKYFYIGYPEPPQEGFTDQLLRLLTQGENIDVKKEIFVMLRDIVQDHYYYSSFLIANKKIVPKLKDILEIYTNNKEIRSSVYKLIHYLISNTTWHEDILILVDPIVRMMHEQQSIDSVAAKIQILFIMAQLKPQIIARYIYQNKVHKMCIEVLKQSQSRMVMLLYLKFLIMFENYHQLKFDDVNQFLEINCILRQREYKVGQSRVRYTVYEIKLTAFKLINKILRSQEETFREAGIKNITKDVFEQLAKELQTNQDQKIFTEVIQIILAYYLATEQRIDPQLQKLLCSSISNCQSYKKRVNLQAEYDYITRQTETDDGIEIQV